MKKIFCGAIVWISGMMSVWSQSDFNPSVKDWMDDYGTPMATIYTELKSAQKDKGSVKKLKSFDEIWGNDQAKVEKLTGLELLFMKNNGVTSFGPEFMYLTNLQIWVSHQNSVTYVDSNIRFLKKLSIFEVRGASLDSLPRQFEELNYLRVLRVMENGAAEMFFPDSLDKIPNLVAFQFYRTPLAAFPAFLMNSPYVENIMMQQCKLTVIPDSICKMKNLQYLDLEKNEIEEVPKTLAQCTSLRILNLRNNKLTHIPEWISRFPHLEYLDLRGNDISVEELDLIITLIGDKAVVMSDFQELKLKYDMENSTD